MLVTKKLTKTYDRQQTKFDAVHEVDFSLDRPAAEKVPFSI